MDNLIDLRDYPQKDVELIAREFMRIVYIDACKDYATEAEKKDSSDEEAGVLKNIEDILQAIEKVIIMLDGDDEFLKFATSGGEEDVDGNSDSEEEFPERF